MNAKTKQETWWDNLSVEVKNSINKTLFYQKVLDVNIAYSKLGGFVY